MVVVTTSFFSGTTFVVCVFISVVFDMLFEFSCYKTISQQKPYHGKFSVDTFLFPDSGIWFRNILLVDNQSIVFPEAAEFLPEAEVAI